METTIKTCEPVVVWGCAGGGIAVVTVKCPTCGATCTASGTNHTDAHRRAMNEVSRRECGSDE